MKNDGDWISVRKQGATASSTLSISDFLTSDARLKSVSAIFQSLKAKGFSQTSDKSDDVTVYKKGNCTINYYLEEMEGPKGTDSFNITFSSPEQAKKFIQSISKSSGWVPQKNYFGNIIGWKKNRVTIEHLDISPESITIINKR